MTAGAYVSIEELFIMEEFNCAINLIFHIGNPVFSLSGGNR